MPRRVVAMSVVAVAVAVTLGAPYSSSAGVGRGAPMLGGGILVAHGGRDREDGRGRQGKETTGRGEFSSRRWIR